MKIFNFCFLMALFAVSSASFGANKSGDYPQFVYSTWGSKQVQNIPQFTRAIEEGPYIKMAYNQETYGALSAMIPEVAELGSYYEDVIFTRAFVSATKNLVKEFGCVDYRYRKGMPESDGCKSYVRDEKVEEYFPFSGGQYFRSPLEITSKGRNGKTELVYYMSLKAGNKYESSSIWYPVHRMGPAFSNHFNSDDLVLTVSVNFELINADGYPDGMLFDSNRVFWIVIPGWKKIVQQKSPVAAGNFAANNIELLVAIFPTENNSSSSEKKSVQQSKPARKTIDELITIEDMVEHLM